MRSALDAVGDELENVEVSRVEYWMDPETPARLQRHRKEALGIQLLPGLNELLLGYRDRSPSLPPAQDKAVCPGGNGMFKATVVKGGQIIGTWKQKGSGTNVP